MTIYVSDIFHKLLPFGQKDNIRLVIVNRRDYDGSTKYTDDNLKEFHEGKMSSLDRLGAEVAHFLVWFVETQKIPKINAARSSGGFSVMAWSMGNATLLCLLGCPEYVGTEAYTKLEPYCRQLVLYGYLITIPEFAEPTYSVDPSFGTMGYDEPSIGYFPFAVKEPLTSLLFFCTSNIVLGS
jgi:hypothetical protein